jgi:molybdopterin/thiamine biosynthesis adenylyltransferase
MSDDSTKLTMATVGQASSLARPLVDMGRLEACNTWNESNGAGPDERLIAHPTIGVGGRARLRARRVAVAGLGNVGSRVAAALAAAGIPLVAIDSGVAEPANVGWQLYAEQHVGSRKCDATRRQIAAVRPELPVQCVYADVRRLGPRVLDRCDLVVGCVDSYSARVWLAQTCTLLRLPYVDLALDGTGQSLYGVVRGFDTAAGSACLACSWDAENWDALQQEQGDSGCAALVAAAQATPPTLALPGLGDIVAGLGVVQIVRVMLDADAQRVIGREIRLNLSIGRLHEVSLAANQRCRLRHRPWDATRLDVRPDELTVGQLFQLATDRLGRDVALEAYADPMVGAAACIGCRRSDGSPRLRSRLGSCSGCGELLVPLIETVRSRFERSDFPAAIDRTWADLGLPRGGAVAAHSADDEHVFLFAVGDS